MAFWSDASTEPLRQFRWTVTFGGTTTNLDNIVFALKKFSRPKLKVGEVTHKYLNHSFYYPGRVEWEPVTLTMASVGEGGDPGTAHLFLNVLANSGYIIPSGVAPGQRTTLSKEGFRSSIGDLEIKNLGQDGAVVEQFIIHNPFFTSIEFGELDYSSEEVLDVTATIRYDYATFHNSSNSKPITGTPSLT